MKRALTGTIAVVLVVLLLAVLHCAPLNVSRVAAAPMDSPSVRAAVRLKYNPPPGWIRHYLGDDRYKVAGNVWRVVSTQLDTYYHRPNCPNMLRQPAGIVIGFPSGTAAVEGGYRPDPLCAPEEPVVQYAGGPSGSGALPLPGAGGAGAMPFPGMGGGMGGPGAMPLPGVGSGGTAGGRLTPGKLTVVTSRGGRFRVLMPGQPRTVTVPVQTPSGPINFNMVGIGQGNTGYLVAYGDLPIALNPALRQAVLIGARTGMVTSSRGRLLSERRLSLAGHPGREFLAAAPNGTRLRARIYMVGNRFYMVMATAPSNQISSSTRQRFFSSFRLLR